MTDLAVSGEWFVLRPEGDMDDQRLLLFRPEPAQPVGFLFPSDDTALHGSLLAETWGTGIVPVRITSVAQPGRCRLTLYRSAAFISVGIDGRLSLESSATSAVCSRFEDGTVRAIGPELEQHGLSIAELHRNARSATWLGEGATAALQNASRSAMQVVIAALTREELARLADCCLGSPDLASRLAVKLGADAWTESLVGLSRWNLDRDGAPRPMSVSPELSFLATDVTNKRPRAHAAELTFALRRQTMPRHRCGAVATACNEGPFLLDWIAYHRSIGVEQIVIYSNANTDGSDDLLDALDKAGAILWLDNPTPAGNSAQFKAYGHALGMLPHTLDCEWTLIVDVDEYFGFDVNRFTSLPDYLAWQEGRQVDAIQLNWLVFGPPEKPSSPALTGFPGRYAQRLPYVDDHVKTLFRTRFFDHANAHVPLCHSETAPVVRRADGEVIRHQLGGGLEPFVQGGLGEPAWINHYLLRSPSEMLVKWMRNRGDEAVSTDRRLHLHPEIVRLFLYYLDGAELVQDSRIAACASGMAAERARLLGLPGVGDATAAVESPSKIMFSVGRAFVASAGLTPSGGMPARFG